MKTTPQLLTLLALSSLTSIATAGNQTPAYNRSIQGAELTPAQSGEPGHYDLRIGLAVNVGEAHPGQGEELDLSCLVDVKVDGQTISTLFWEDIVRVADGQIPCEQQSSCDNQACGINSTPGGDLQMRCVAPVEFADCMCTSDVFLEADDLFVPVTGGTITIEIDTVANQLPELYTGDDGFEFPFIGENYCVAGLNSTGNGATITATGSPSVSFNNLTLEARPLPANQFGIFYYGGSQMQIPFGQGFRCVGGQTFRLPVTSSGNQGELRLTLDLSSPPEPAGLITAGSTHFFQAWYRDPAGGGVGFNLSDGYMIAFIP